MVRGLSHFNYSCHYSDCKLGFACRTKFLTVPDVAVLSLPLSYNQEWLALLAFLGGFSASTGMLLVSSVALSIMLSNDLIMPALWRFKLLSRHDKHLPKVLKFSRRISIVAVMLLGFLFFHFFNDINQLSVFGLLAFSAVAQFAPALIGGLYWRGGSRQGVYAGLIVGFLMWSYTLLFPTILRSLPEAYQKLLKVFYFSVLWALMPYVRNLYLVLSHLHL
jgi:Na+/proline symporter